MGCQSSKAAVCEQSPDGAKLLGRLNNGPQSEATPLQESKPTVAEPPKVSLASSNSTAIRNGPLRREPTVSLNREDVGILVTKFTCNTTLHSKDFAWSVQASRDLAPMELKVHVDRSILLTPEVSVTCNDNRLFPTSSGRVKGKLLEDFRYQWPFRGTLQERINEPRWFEMWAPTYNGTKQCCPAIITKQRGDGLFEVLADMADNYGFVRRNNFPAVSKADIREVGSEEPLHVSEQSLVLEVPKTDPMLAALSVDGHGVATHFLGRPSPAVDREQKVPSFRISDDRKRISANMGHGELSHFLSGEVRNVGSDLQRYNRSWTIQIGPFAEHVVKVTRHAWPSKIVTLTIDDEVLVDASAEDIGCADATWECKFHFAAEKVMNFDVYESNLDGVPLETRGQVVKREKKLHECVVTLKDDLDFSKAEFVIDGAYFQDLPPKATLYPEEALDMEVETFLGTYGPIVPRKINRAAPTGFGWALVAFAKEGGTTDSAAAVNGLTVMRASASEAARSGVAAAVSAAASGAEAMGAVAVEYSPAVAEAAENTAKKAGHSLSEMLAGINAAGMLARCYAAEKAEEVTEIESMALIQDNQIQVVPATERVQYISAAASL